MHLRHSRATLAGVLCAVLAASIPGVSSASDVLQLRAGSASSKVSTEGNGGWGLGFGYAKGLKDRKLWVVPFLRNSTLGANIEYNELARFGNAVESEVPFSLELLWHSKTKQVRPYVGLGGGAYYRKLSGTGDDKSFLRDAWHLAIGADAPIGDHQQLGLDARFAFTDSNNGTPNPVFGLGAADALHWGIKLTWSLLYDPLPQQH